MLPFGVLESEGQSCPLPALTGCRWGRHCQQGPWSTQLAWRALPAICPWWFVLACGLSFSSWLGHKPSRLCVGVRMVKGRWDVWLRAALVQPARLTPSKYLPIEQNRAECLMTENAQDRCTPPWVCSWLCCRGLPRTVGAGKGGQAAECPSTHVTVSMCGLPGLRRCFVPALPGGSRTQDQVLLVRAGADLLLTAACRR